VTRLFDTESPAHPLQCLRSDDRPKGLVEQQDSALHKSEGA